LNRPLSRSLPCSDLSAITKKFVRGLLEKQFSLCEGALDGRRSEINAYIESAIEACDAEEEQGEGSMHDQEEQGAKKKKGGWGFVEVSPQLRAVIGDGDVSRGDIIHRMWKHIKAHNLQDPSDKRFILCDAALKQIFKSGRVSMFKMNKELTRHIWKPEKDESPPRPASAAKVKKTPSKTPEKSISKKATSSKASAAAKDKKKPKTSACSSDEPKKLNGLQQPKPLAAKLADFMGSGQASRLDVNKKIWEHIKSNNLQSADNRSIINCDTQLKHLLGQSTVSYALSLSPARDTKCSILSAVYIILVKQIPQPALFERVSPLCCMLIPIPHCHNARLP
jgi:upstream activation factor subunit UAF30